jgi:hypothetical protein
MFEVRGLWVSSCLFSSFEENTSKSRVEVLKTLSDRMDGGDSRGHGMILEYLADCEAH